MRDKTDPNVATDKAYIIEDRSVRRLLGKASGNLIAVDDIDEGPPPKLIGPAKYTDLADIRERCDRLFRLIWYNGFCDMQQLRQKRHYLETIAECSRELPTIVDYHQTGWLLEWQMEDRVRKLCVEFSRLHNVGRILACSERPDKSVFITPPMRTTGDNIRLAFKWYYTKEHTIWLESAKPSSESASESSI